MTIFSIVKISLYSLILLTIPVEAAPAKDFFLFCTIYKDMDNMFGHKIHEIKDIFKDTSIEKNIRKMLNLILHHLEVSKQKSEKIIDDCLNVAKSHESIFDYEKKAYKILNDEGVAVEIPIKLAGRANMIYNQIKPHLIEGSVLDLGCGDGKVGELLSAENRPVHLCDVYRHVNIDNLNLKFTLYNQGDCCPFEDKEFDNVLMITVLHHSDDPVKLIQECRRVAKQGGRVIVIESVYGVDGTELSGEEKERIKNYLGLNEEQQRMTNIFFDHFYNRVFFYNEDPKTKVNVPFNFNTPSGWKKIFEDNGFMQEKIIHLGIDQPTAPEYHTLHVLRAN